MERITLDFLEMKEEASCRIVINKPRFWTEKEDAILANSMLKSIKDGDTLASGYAEAGEKLNRSIAACRNRWNSVIRRNYETEIKKAKQHKMEKTHDVVGHLIKEEETLQVAEMNHNQKKLTETKLEEQFLPDIQHITIEDCIEYLTNSQSMKEKNQKLKAENLLLKNENERLKLKYNELVKKKRQNEEKYYTLMKIVQQASKLNDDSLENKKLLH